MEISKRRGGPQRLGFAYQLGFVRAFQRFPVQQPLEICEELLSLGYQADWCDFAR